MIAGEGGMVTTSNSDLAARARLLINHGQTQKYEHSLLGYNYRMIEMCAAIGCVQLKKLDTFNKKRKQNAALLNKGIQKIDGLTVPYAASDVKHVFHQYVIRVEDSYPLSRDQLADKLVDKGVGSAVHYPVPICRQPLYVNLGYGNVLCPNCEDAAKRVLSLPVHPLVTQDDVEYIVDVLNEISDEA